MLRRRFAPLVVLLLALSGSARAQDDAVRKEIDAQYQIMAAAMAERKPDGFVKTAAPGFVFVNLIGKELTLEQANEHFVDVVKGINDLKVFATIKELVVKGDEATTIGSMVASGDMPNADGKVGPGTMTGIDRSTWVKDGGAWKIKKRRTVSVETRVMGNLVNPPFTPEADAVRKELRAYYDAVGDIYSKKDWDNLKKGIPADFDIRDANGDKLTAQELVDRVKAGAKDISDPIMSIAIQRVDVQGGKATVVRILRLIGDIMLGGATHRVKYVQVARDTWAKGEKGWNGKGSYELYSEAALDGKPVPLAQIGGK